MGTKANPGKFDCHTKAADDEPLFTLRAKDPTAPGFVDMWRAVRAGHYDEARQILEQVIGAWESSGRSMLPLDSEKSLEAKQVAVDMEAWVFDQHERKEHGQGKRGEAQQT